MTLTRKRHLEASTRPGMLSHRRAKHKWGYQDDTRASRACV